MYLIVPDMPDMAHRPLATYLNLYLINRTGGPFGGDLDTMDDTLPLPLC